VRWNRCVGQGSEPHFAVPDQEGQQVEYLRLDRNELGAAPQLAPIDIKRMTGKGKQHVDAPKATSILVR
jgi:hypothetical protein